MFHLAAWAQTLDPGGILTPINVVHEDLFFTDDKDFRVPEVMPFIIGTGITINNINVEQARFNVPSLAEYGHLAVEPIEFGNVFGSVAEVSFFPYAPLRIVPGEHIRCEILSTPGVSILHTGLLWISDGPLPAVPGTVFSVGATAAIQQVQRTWQAGPLVFDQTLPAGAYVVVGMRVRSGNGSAARLIFHNQRSRPGVPVINAIGAVDDVRFRHGAPGVFGMFQVEDPPELEMLNGTQTSQRVILDLVRF